MIKWLLNAFNDVIRSKDGSVSLTKLAATTAHFNAAWLFVYITLQDGYISELWALYIGMTILHASYDKTAQIWKSKNSALQQD